jgi:hypothetical protein
LRYVLQRQRHDSGRSIFSVGSDLESQLPTHLEHRPIDVRDPGEIERAIVTFAQSPNGGLIISLPHPHQR